MGSCFCGDPDRRRFLGRLLVGAAAFLAAGRAGAIGPSTRFHIAQLRYFGGNWNPRPTAAVALAQEVRFRTSIDVALERHYVGLDSQRLFNSPFLLMLGDRDHGQLPRFHAEMLKKYLELGGFLFVDNVGKTASSAGFDRAFRADLMRMFPGRQLEPIPPDHVIYRTFYRVDFPAGRIVERPFLEGLRLDRRIGLVYSRNDLSGAWARDQFGAWQYDVIPGGDRQRETAFRLGVNLVLYALCLDYKDDQVHLDYLLRKRNWRIRAPKAGR